MATLYPSQDTFVRGEISPRLHTRASLEAYRAGLARCLNWLTLPHGGLRRRGGSYFVGEVKNSANAARLVPFVFSSDQAYVLEFGDLYVRVYAYGARVGTVEVVTPWTSAEVPALQFYQSADIMWIAHPDYALRTLTRTAHTTWALAEYVLEDGPFDDINIDTTTTLTPASRGKLDDLAGTPSSTSGTAADAFDGSAATHVGAEDITTLTVTYTLSSGEAVSNAYYMQATSNKDGAAAPVGWEFQGYNGTTWVTLDTRRAEVGWSKGETRFYEFTNKNAFEAYRVVVTGSSMVSDDDIFFAELGINQYGDDQTPFALTASSINGINGNTGFQTTDVGRLLRLRGSDGEWRWAKITARNSTTQVLIRLYGQALPNLTPISAWRLGALSDNTGYAKAVTVFEERLAVARRFSVFLSESFKLKSFAPGEEDDDGMEFQNAGGGQANDIVWLADGDGYLLIATTGGIRALSGSGIDEALTPSSFKNRRSRTHGASRIAPVDAGSSFLYVTRSRQTIAELTMNQYGRFTSEDVGQISEHIPKKGVVQLAYQENPDPILWFPLDTGDLGGFTHQPSQEVRGMHRHVLGGALTGEDWPFVESVAVTPGADGLNDDVWLIVRRTINGATKRYIELLTAPMEGGALMDAICVDSALTYSGAAVTTVGGLSHLAGQVVDVLADGKVYRGRTVTGGGNVSLPSGSAAAAKWHVGLPFPSEADTLELDAGGRDGSLIGRRKKVAALLLSLYETDITGLEISSMQRGAWETVRLPSVATPVPGAASLFTGNVKVPIDDSWEGMARVRIRHVGPTPCTIRAATPVFDAEP